MKPFSHYYIGLDVHRLSISYCIKHADGTIVSEGKIAATYAALSEWAARLPEPWCGGLEATLSSHWIYYHLQRYARELFMADPQKLKAISSAKRKNDTFDARTLADLLRCHLFPACYVLPEAYQSLQAGLRERAFLVRARVQCKNKTVGLLMARGVPYQTRSLHGKRYYEALLREQANLLEDLKPLLSFHRQSIEQLQAMDRWIVQQLLRAPLLQERVARLQAIPGVGEITALTWALETGEPSRFPHEKHAISYCGLCAAPRASAGQEKRGPLSKQRNPHLQTTLIEAAHIAVQHNDKLRPVYQAARQRGPQNRATLEVARCLVRWLLAIDRPYFAAQAAAAA